MTWEPRGGGGVCSDVLPRWLLAASLVAAAAVPARGETPSIGIGYLGPQVTIEHVRLELRDEPRPRTAHLALVLAATHTARRELAATIQLPAGTRVTGFAYTGGEGERQVARPMPAKQAGASYAIVKGSHDGALVEAAGADRLALRVPIAAEQRAEIELELALPPLSELAIDPGGQTVRRTEIRIEGRPHEIRDDVAGPERVALPRVSAPAGRTSGTSDLAPMAEVSAETSLLVGEAPSVVIGIPTTSCGGPARNVRRVVRWHHPQLRYCYMRVAQWNPQIEGTAVLRFVIGEDGRVKSSTVESDLGEASIERCLAGEVAQWDFGAAPGGGEIQVNYPLTFRLAR